MQVRALETIDKLARSELESARQDAGRTATEKRTWRIGNRAAANSKMYSPKIVKRNIDLYQKKTRRQLKRHSLDYCRKAVAFLDDLLDDDGNLDKTKRPNGLNPDEKSFIKNEITLCRFDFNYYLPRYAVVQHSDADRLVPFNLRKSQQVLMALWGNSEERGLAIANIVNKARQEGVTSLTEAAVAHRVQFLPNVNAVVGSSDPDKSKLMVGKMELIWENQPWWMKPNITSYRAGSMIEFGKQNSGVSIQHGSQFTGLARGSTTGCVHLSECVDYVNPEDLIDASLMGAVHESPSLFLVFESTSKGRHNWWHRQWELSMANWPRTLLRPVFLPWFLADDIYPTPTELRRNPVPADWVPPEHAVKHAERAAIFVKNDPFLRQYLGARWTLPREQMWWWACKYAEFKEKGQLSQFFSEYPASPDESFQSTNISVFNTEIITATRDRADKSEPVGVFTVTGDACSERLYPDRRELDLVMPKLPVVARTAAGPIKFELLPLKTTYPNCDPTNKVFIWEFPKDGSEYHLGVDTSEGIGLDRSVIQVIRKRDPYKAQDFDTQVAEFASPWANKRDLWPIVLALASMYSTRVSGKLLQPRLVIECNAGGEMVQYELRKLGWWHFHPWAYYDSKRPNTSSNKIGWWTNVRTRALAVDTLVTSLRDEWLIVNSPWFVDEMADFERDENKQSIKAAYGSHDDRLMSLAFVLTSMYINEITVDGRTFFGSRKAVPEQQGSTVNLHESTYNEKMKDAMKKQPYSSMGQYNPY